MQVFLYTPSLFWAPQMLNYLPLGLVNTKRQSSCLPVHHQLRSLPNWYPLIWWCHLIISSSVVPFTSCLQSFPASGSFQMSQLLTTRKRHTFYFQSIWDNWTPYSLFSEPKQALCTLKEKIHLTDHYNDWFISPLKLYPSLWIGR